jgi:hypothetical protein
MFCDLFHFFAGFSPKLESLREQQISVFDFGCCPFPFVRSEIFKMILKGGASSVLKNFVEYVWQQGVWTCQAVLFCCIFFEVG